MSLLEAPSTESSPLISESFNFISLPSVEIEFVGNLDEQHQARMRLIDETVEFLKTNPGNTMALWSLNESLDELYWFRRRFDLPDPEMLQHTAA
jgi:hypothetical protein